MCRTRNPKYGPNRILAELMSHSDDSDSDAQTGDLEENELHDFSQGSEPRRKGSLTKMRTRAFWARFTTSCSRCWVWLRVQEERLRCLFYVCTLGLLVMYLRIQEEAYQEQEEDPMAAGHKRIGYKPSDGAAAPAYDALHRYDGHRRLQDTAFPSTFAQLANESPGNYYCDRECRITIIDVHDQVA